MGQEKILGIVKNTGHCQKYWALSNANSHFIKATVTVVVIFMAARFNIEQPAACYKMTSNSNIWGLNFDFKTGTDAWIADIRMEPGNTKLLLETRNYPGVFANDQSWRILLCDPHLFFAVPSFGKWPRCKNSINSALLLTDGPLSSVRDLYKAHSVHGTWHMAQSTMAHGTWHNGIWYKAHSA